LRVILVSAAAFLLNVLPGIPPIEVLILAAVADTLMPVHGDASVH
jgi:hypothetical protein